MKRSEKSVASQNRPRGKCKYCGRPLVPVANARKNGTTRHNDWKTRKYHKKCFLEHQNGGLIR